MHMGWLSTTRGDTGAVHGESVCPKMGIDFILKKKRNNKIKSFLKFLTDLIKTGGEGFNLYNSRKFENKILIFYRSIDILCRITPNKYYLFEP